MADLLKLHVGCGKRFIPGFVHIDQVAFAHVDHVQDIRRLPNFADNSAEPDLRLPSHRIFRPRRGYWRPHRLAAGAGAGRHLAAVGPELCRYLQALPVRHSAREISGNALRTYSRRQERICLSPHDLRRTVAERAPRHSSDFTTSALWDWRQTEHAAVDDFSQAYFPHMDKENGLLFNLNMQGKK